MVAATTELPIWLTPTLSLITGVVGAGIGATTTRSVSRTSRAHELYNNYLKRCLDRPDLASYNAFVGLHDGVAYLTLDPYVFESKSSEEYHWFLSLMLAAMEEILGIKWHDKGWRRIIEDQIVYHLTYFRKNWPGLGPSYSGHLNAIVASVLKEYQNA